MGLGQSAAVPDAMAPGHVLVRRPRDAEHARASERRALRARLRAEILPGIERLVDPSRDPAELIALAGVEGRRVRAMLTTSDADGDLVGFHHAERRARVDEREWARGYLHDTALQILEFIAGDGFDTGLTADKISNLAGGAASDLRRWIDAGAEPSTARLVPELEQVTAEARALHQGVQLVVGDIASEPTGEQVTALAGAVREAVTNARKHASASAVIVRVESGDDGQTAVTVTDDGVGLDLERAARSSGFGVAHSIVGRMQRVGGRASLGPAPGGGTCVTLVASMLEAPQ